MLDDNVSNTINPQEQEVQKENQKENKPYDRGFLEKIEGLNIRQNMDISLIANNRSFVGRANRVTHGQLRAYERGMEKFGILYDKTKNLIDICKETKDDVLSYDEAQAIVLDIGFGSGHSLVQMAKASPQELFVGIETFRPGIGSLFVQGLAQSLNNIRCVHGDAVSVLFHMIEENSIDRIQIFFPDPWQKSRHKRRRLIQSRFLQLCLHILKPEGILWIVSDWEDYAINIKKTLENFSQAKILEHYQNDSYLSHNPELEKALEEQRLLTRFENKGLKKGHHIYPFVYQKLVF